MFSPYDCGGVPAAAVCLTFVSQAAWSFAERSGARAGLAAIDIGNWLAVNGFLSRWLSRRHTFALGCADAGEATGMLFVGAGSPLIYVVPLLASGFAYGFSTPFIFGTAAKLGRAARWSPMATRVMRTERRLRRGRGDFGVRILCWEDPRRHIGVT